jgi:hypothetical protein
VKAIIAAPFIFAPTQLSHAMSDELEKVIRGFGWTVIRLHGPQNLRVVFSYVLSYHPDAVLVVYMGHASPTMFAGEEVAGPGILALDNVGEARERIIVGLPACLSAQRLGPASVLAGAKAFVGSREEMYAQWNEQDAPYMQHWFDYTLTFYRSLVASLTAGKSVEEALSKALTDYRDRCTYYMELYKRNLETWVSSDFYYTATRQNRDFVVGLIR